MIIRKAEENDLEDIVQIYNQAVVAGQRTADTEPVTVDSRKKWFSDHTSDKYPILVAESNGKITGWLSISPYRPGRMALRHTAEVSYYVHFDYHKQGLAGKLLKEAINMCPSIRIKTLFAILLDSNRGSIRLLTNHGFVKWGHMPKIADFNGIEVGHLYYGLRIKKTVT
jgi:L-amino acid N-acyltransferase YncA